jgi:arabinogalactan endo-1,4-beta-galactosidase
MTHAAFGADELRVGVDANYAPGMEREGRQWRWDGVARDPFDGIAAAGVQSFRVRLWTSDEGPHGRREATAVTRRALAAGLEPYLVIFLSADWADLMKQPAPADWQELDVDGRAAAVRRYARETVAHFRKAGLRSHVYEIGNEIDYGICGVYPGKGTKKNPESLRRRCWPDAARIITAAQAGVLEADPEARFMLHIAHWWDARFCIDFFRFMIDTGVRVDLAGLSYFPSAAIGGSLEMEQFGDVVTRLHEAVGLPVVVAETAYPASREFTGQFARWKREAPGYPLTPEGQRRWLADFLAFCHHHPHIHEVFYWSPEWFGLGMWQAFALFDMDGEARPAWTACAVPPAGRPRPRRSVHVEIVDGTLRAVPVPEARDAAAAALREELGRHGGMTTGYIDAITARGVRVAGYHIRLRATLTGILELSADGPTDNPDWQIMVDALNPVDERLVVFIRNADDPLVEAVLARAADRGLEAVTHRVPADTPLRFGFTPVQPVADP